MFTHLFKLFYVFLTSLSYQTTSNSSGTETVRTVLRETLKPLLIQNFPKNVDGSRLPVESFLVPR